MKTNVSVKAAVLLVMVMMTALFISAGTIENKDAPAKGEYIFPMEKVWQVDTAGEMPFGNVVTVLVSDSGKVYLRDLKNKEYYIFGKDGTFSWKFGTRGEGPGEIKTPGGASISVLGNDVLVEDVDKILYFTEAGKFLRSKLNNRNTRPSVLFLNKDEFISAPANILGVPGGKAKMRYVNLKTGEERVITDFTAFKGAFIQREGAQAAAVIPTITPVLIVGELDGKIYFGKNDKYTVYITDLQGKDIGSFSLERKPKAVSLKEREDVMLSLAKGYVPDDVARQLAKTLPDKETLFANIISQDGKLYVYRSHFTPVGHQQIDIFSPEGKYLYRGIVNVEKGMIIKAGPTFKDGYIYLSTEDEEGEIYVVKYKTKLPQ